MCGPAVDIMAMSLDSHVVNHGSSPGPSCLNSRRAHVHMCLRSQEENGRKGVAEWPSPPGSDFSFSVSLSLSVLLANPHTLWQKPLQKNKIGTSSWCNGCVAGLPCSQPWFESQTQWLKHAWHMCVRAQGPERRRDCSMAIPSGGLLLAFCLSLSVFPASK